MRWVEPGGGVEVASGDENYALLVEAGEFVSRRVGRRVFDSGGTLTDETHWLYQGALNRNTAPVRLTVDDDAWRFEAQLLNWKRAAIFGGGHCALALSRVLNNLGYTVSVFDTRAEVFTFTGNDHARHRVTVADFKDAGAHLKYPELTHAIVMTREQPADVRALIGLIERPLPYIGVMGSPAKLAMIRRDLIHAGFDKSVLDAENIYAPIGLPMTSNTPEEIAISIAGELLAERGVLFPMV